MEDVAPLAIQPGQHVTIDCEGSDFSMYSANGNLTMGPDSRLHYVGCKLQQYIFPEGSDVRGTVHTMSNSTFEMQSCRVRRYPGLPPQQTIVFTHVFIMMCIIWTRWKAQAVLVHG